MFLWNWLHFEKVKVVVTTLILEKLLKVKYE